MIQTLTGTEHKPFTDWAMLTVHPIYKQHDREELYKQFQPLTSCWVVSDLQSKKALRKMLLLKHEAMLEDSILRAQELWKYILKRVAPEFEVIPRANLALWLKAQLRQLRAEADVEFFAEQHASGLLDMMSTFVPVFCQSGHFEQLQSFFNEQQWQDKNWNEQLIVAYKLWQKIVEKKWLIPDWVVHFLGGAEGEITQQQVFFNELWVDLGADLRQAEAEYFVALAKMGFQVHIILPRFHRRAGEDVVFQPYEVFGLPPAQKELLNSNNSQVLSLQAESPIAEAQTVVRQLRSLAEKSVGPVQWERLAIAAPEIESYWKILGWLLPAEGIPVQKPMVAAMLDFPWATRFLKHLLARAEFAGQGLLDFQGFCAQALLPQETVEPQWVDFLLRAQVSPFDKEKLNWQDWMTWVQEQLQKVEVEIGPEYQNGVYVVNLAEVEHLQLDHLFVLGLSADQLRPELVETVPFTEMAAIHSHLGYFLRHLEQSRLVLSLRWTLVSRNIPIVLSRSQTNMAGKMVPPHSLWLEQQTRAISEKAALLWDFALPAPPAASCSMSFPEITAANELVISASSIDTFAKCSMRWGLEQRLRLREDEVNEFGLGGRDSGTLIHDLLATAIGEKWFLQPLLMQNQNLLHEKVQQLLVAKAEGARLAPLIWEVAVAEMSKQLFQFLQHEVQWRDHHPGTQTIAIEKAFALPLSGVDNKTVLAGKFDRVDLDGAGGLHIIDYKSSLKSDYSFRRIGEELSYTQLSTYAMAALQIWPEHPLRSVTIWSYKTAERGYGFQIEQADPWMKKTEKISQDQWIAVQAKTMQYFVDVVELIRRGEFSPNPRDEKICETCDWSRLCRAPHLFQ